MQQTSRKRIRDLLFHGTKTCDLSLYFLFASVHAVRRGNSSSCFGGAKLFILACTGRCDPMPRQQVRLSRSRQDQQMRAIICCIAQGCNCDGFWTPATRRLRTLTWPASKKRQGTKSREVGHRLSSGRYGDLMLAPNSMMGGMLTGFDLRVVSDVQEGFRRVFGARQRAIHALMDAIGSRGIAAGV